jgi:hypothetical protein
MPTPSRLVLALDETLLQVVSLTELEARMDVAYAGRSMANVGTFRRTHGDRLHGVDDCTRCRRLDMMR